MRSFSARVVNGMLRLRGLKKSFGHESDIRKAVAKDRARGPAVPGKSVLALCDVREERVEGSLCYHLTPKSGGSGQHIVYFHGGGYVFDIVAEHWGFLAKLIAATGVSVTVPIYPLAPEADWRDGYRVAEAVYADALERHDAKRIALMGDSAGAGMALGLAMMLRDSGAALPGKIALLSPWLDATASDPEQEALSPYDRIIALNGLRTMGRWWAGHSGDPAAFPVSLLDADLTGLPPVGIWSGTHDVLYPDARRYKAKADAAGVRIAYHVYQQMQHVWMLLPVAEAKPALLQIVSFLKR